MNSCLQVHLIQPDIFWLDEKKNIENYTGIINASDLKPGGIIFLPEMFTTGFTVDVKHYAQKMDGTVVNWLKKMADTTQCAIGGSLIIEENLNYYNRFVIVTPNLQIYTYDKRHLFRMGEEHQNFTSGSQKQIITYKNWQIQPLVCYDLRFPVWSRNCNNYDVLVYVANWPLTRREAWLTLIKARAIENQCYVIAVNRIGSDGNNLLYAGDSMVIDPKGEILLNMGNACNSMQTISIDLKQLNDYRASFPVWMDGDNFMLI